MLILRKEAEEDIKEAYDWYESQRENLGQAFITEIEQVLEAIQESPVSYTQVFKPVRRTLCKKFPYAIYFVLRHADIVVLAILHQRRRPALWQERA